ncbi:class I adenylate-forming enzyme family protein [Pseudonocardia sp. WMMC193]|uniref:class I adenylate-forming enzyme family protein n=1 Tax=Pseudonocardia sp. WMMC193 TaxID=2911965 RepID=UPI001F1F2ED6|nr:class I adenylate-forming enzyme family protein [Pseudonocardia sp. WMMC193]MCF7550529.1 acyl--CoA ligase [Pseudonocardia sp. WMMC193]
MTAGSLAPSVRTAAMALLTAPGGEFALVDAQVRGVPWRVFERGPHTLRELAEFAAGTWGERVFTVYGHERVTYAEHAAQVRGLAALLRAEYGLERGDRVAVTMRNHPEWAPWFYACMVSGLVIVPLNAWWTGPELRYALEDCEAALVVADGERAASLGDPGIPMIEVRGTGGAGRPWAEVLARVDRDAPLPDVVVDPDDDATILYTSGTTGRPKGAVGTHRNHCTNILNTLLGARVSATIANGGVPPEPDPAAPQTGALCTFPLFHIAGITSLTFTPLVGGKLATQYRWDPDEALELVRREQLTGVSGVPTVGRQFLEHAAGRPGLETLTALSMGGASIPPDLIGRVDAQFTSAVAPANGYGLTETTSAVVANSGADYVRHPDSVGRCQPGTDLRVVDPGTGEDAPEGEVGELWFRGPNVVRGYWNNPEGTAAAFTDGWFHTGDLGYVREGWVFVVDRMKDVVIRGGENIYCAEVEAALFEHPAVADVAIVGVPHERLGEQAVAVVTTRAEVTAAQLQQHVRERLAEFKVPERVVFRAEPLPRTPSGKVLKRELRTEVAP